MRVLDIGCGHGDVTAEIIKLNSEASFTLIDYSKDMVVSSSERFKDNSKIKILQHDLNNGLPETITDEKFDVVVSCFSLHHIEYYNRIKLYSDIFKVLDENTFFINGDMFKGDSSQMNEWEFDNWVNWMVVKIKEHLGQEKTFEEIKKRQLESFEKMGDKPGTLWDMYSDLKMAGFKNVDCMLKIQNLAVIVAAK